MHYGDRSVFFTTRSVKQTKSIDVDNGYTVVASGDQTCGVTRDTMIELCTLFTPGLNETNIFLKREEKRQGGILRSTVPAFYFKRSQT
ncbi:hypothetical protein RRG08_019494 [Elysia crispata]|uniref:Uncharacterized protein n=1 Tax=Elysia crispata TaxID=231223 RepID=A0AAE0YJT8_9GAST|nr:hypothetical protein RRG08_019494 [Elysia crispata]